MTNTENTTPAETPTITRTETNKRGTGSAVVYSMQATITFK